MALLMPRKNLTGHLSAKLMDNSLRLVTGCADVKVENAYLVVLHELPTSSVGVN